MINHDKPTYTSHCIPMFRLRCAMSARLPKRESDSGVEERTWHYLPPSLGLFVRPYSALGKGTKKTWRPTEPVLMQVLLYPRMFQF